MGIHPAKNHQIGSMKNLHNNIPQGSLKLNILGTLKLLAFSTSPTLLSSLSLSNKSLSSWVIHGWFSGLVFLLKTSQGSTQIKPTSPKIIYVDFQPNFAYKYTIIIHYQSRNDSRKLEKQHNNM